jgi:hypothetical protein
MVHAGGGQPDGKLLGDGSVGIPSICTRIGPEKMHLCHFAFGGEFSIVAAPKRRRNFLFARSKRHIYRK